MCSLIHNNRSHNAYALKTPYQIAQIEELSAIAWDIMAQLALGMKVGMTGLRIEKAFVKLCKHFGVRPALKNFEGFCAHLCINTKGLIGHGLPKDQAFVEGQVITLDFVIEKSFFHSDIAWTFVVEGPVHEVQTLSFDYAQKVSHNLLVFKNQCLTPPLSSPNYRVLPHFAGHGIGREIHEEPVFGYLEDRPISTKIQRGLVFTVEPLIYQALDHQGLEPRQNDRSEWLIDSQMHAQYEFMLAIDKEPRILASRSEGLLMLCESIGRRP